MKVRPAACIIKNSKILLMRYEYNGHSVYNFPGGNRENGELIKETLEREMVEELGIRIKVNELMLVGEVLSKEQKEDVLHCIFNCEITENDPIINKNETSAIDLAWIEIEEIIGLNLYPNIGKELIEKLSDNNKSVYLGEIEQVWY
jgi:8-oxo-dGTP diphosphatase